MLYNLGVYLYGTFIKIAATFNPKAKLWIDGRKDYWKSLPNVSKRNVIWFHCASLGEYDQGKPIIEKWKKNNPTDFILITFFSPSGYENIKNKSIGDYTCYIPLDTPQNAKRFIQHFKPSVTFFVKYEIWVNHLKQAKKSGSRLFLMSALFRENHRFFKWYGGNFRKVLHLFEHIFVQNEKSRKLLENIGYGSITLSGDTRFDRVYQRASEKNTNSFLDVWAKDKNAFVIGSSWTEDEAILIPLINHSIIEAPIIMAPHEINKKNIDSITRQLQVSFQLYTDIEDGAELKSTTAVLILNCIGVLADAYRYGKYAYVGGGFRTGLHNILEPAAFGLPVIFGPKHAKFPEAQQFIDAGIGRDISNSTELIQSYEDFRNQPNIHQKVNRFIEKNVGATDEIIGYFSTTEQQSTD